MKELYFFIFILVFGIIGRSLAMQTSTGCGDLIYNSQVIAHYSVSPGTNLTADVNFLDTSCPATDAINQTASCIYYQEKNPSFNMNCS